MCYWYVVEEFLNHKLFVLVVINYLLIKTFDSYFISIQFFAHLVPWSLLILFLQIKNIFHTDHLFSFN